MKKSRIIFGLGLALISGFAQAQNGLENIIVEKYYIANAADVAASGGKLAPNSVTYRVYVDMLTGYKFQALYGDAAHALKVTSSTTFFNKSVLFFSPEKYKKNFLFSLSCDSLNLDSIFITLTK